MQAPSSEHQQQQASLPRPRRTRASTLLPGPPFAPQDTPRRPPASHPHANRYAGLSGLVCLPSLLPPFLFFSSLLSVECQRSTAPVPRRVRPSISSLGGYRGWDASEALSLGCRHFEHVSAQASARCLTNPPRADSGTDRQTAPPHLANPAGQPPPLQIPGILNQTPGTEEQVRVRQRPASTFFSLLSSISVGDGANKRARTRLLTRMLN